MFKKTITAFCFLACMSFAMADSTDELPQDEYDREQDAYTEDEASDVQQSFNPGLQRTFVICAPAYHLDLNPHTSTYTNEAQIINALQEGLFCYDPRTLDPLPALATAYRISRDKKRWTFTIRDNAKFSDGTPITAQSVIDSWLKLQKIENAPYASLLDCIRGMKDYRQGKTEAAAVGLKARGSSLIVSLNSPTAYLPRLLCHHAFSVFRGDDSVYSGAYTVKSLDEKTLVLAKNENYWDKENVALNEIQIILSENRDENTWMFNTGKADWVMTSLNTDTLLNKNAVRISAIFGTTYLFFTCRNPIWDSAEFRNALITAVPWDKLRKDNLIQATTLVYPLSGYPQVEGLSDYSEDDALEMMEEARSNEGISPDTKLEITFGIADNEYMKELAQVLKDAWEPLGVELVPFKISEDQYLSSVPYLNYDIFSYSWIGDFADPVAFLELFREGSTLNQTKWSNPGFTEKMQQADMQTDAAERYKLLGQAEQILLDDGVVMPISHSISLHAINLRQTGGWYTNALDIHPFKYIFLKEYQEETAPNIVMR